MDFDDLEDVYFAQEVPHEKCIKIGWTQDCDIRLSSLQTGNWRELRILFSITLPKGLGLRLEQFIHKHLANYNERFEWFRIGPENISDLIKASLNAFFDSQPFEIQKILADFTDATIKDELHRRLARPHAYVSFHKGWRDAHILYERHLQAQKARENEPPYWLEEHNASSA